LFSPTNKIILYVPGFPQGKFQESLDAYRKGHEMQVQRGVKEWPTEAWVKAAERLVDLDKEWRAVRDGERKPASAAEYAEFGQLGVYKRLYAVAAGLYQQAFTRDATLADDLAAGHRYQAARAAVLAGCGYDAEKDKLDAVDRARWRQQARDWLHADLALWQHRLNNGQPEDRQAVLQALNHWRTHDHLAGIRDPGRLTELPKDEQRSCQQLWSLVETLLHQARGAKN
jgi:hypothetical protein